MRKNMKKIVTQMLMAGLFASLCGSAALAASPQPQAVSLSAAVRRGLKHHYGVAKRGDATVHVIHMATTAIERNFPDGSRTVRNETRAVVLSGGMVLGAHLGRMVRKTSAAERAQGQAPLLWVDGWIVDAPSTLLEKPRFDGLPQEIQKQIARQLAHADK